MFRVDREFLIRSKAQILRAPLATHFLLSAGDAAVADLGPADAHLISGATQTSFALTEPSVLQHKQLSRVLSQRCNVAPGWHDLAV